MQVVREEAGPELPLFDVLFQWVRNPRNDQERRRLVLQSPDWVNVVALTAEGELVMVRQYRSGTGATTLEIPGGTVEESESSLQAARRELLEETGHVASRWRYLGAVEPNPAFQNNRCHHWLAEEAVPKQAPQPDEGEDIQVVCMSRPQAREEISAGRIRHALALSALARVGHIWTGIGWENQRDGSAIESA